MGNPALLYEALELTCSSQYLSPEYDVEVK